MPSSTDYVIFDSAILKDAIAKINQNCGKQLIVINHHSKVVGMLGDGDVRRAVLHGVLVSAPVADFMKTSFISVEKKDTFRLRDLFTEHLITTIPIITHTGLLHEIALISAPDYEITIIPFVREKK